MVDSGDVFRLQSTPPQPPLPPEIEGYLKKLKRKTSNFTGGWNKRWFFVDPKRREFGYAKNKSPTAPRSSIYLNDITAVVQFDQTHFQVESRTRTFFLCGESKASTSCWVKSLEEYRKKLVEYEKDVAKRATSATHVAHASAVNDPSKLSNQRRGDTSNTKSKPMKKTLEDNPARDSSHSSSTSLASTSVEASLHAADEKTRHLPTEREQPVERRSPSPIEDAPRRCEKRESKPKVSLPIDREPVRGEREGDRGRERERGRDRAREKGRDHDLIVEEKERDRSGSAQRRASNKATLSRTNSRHGEHRARAPNAASGIPGHGYVMEAWVDDFD